MDYAVERTLIAGILSNLSANGISDIIDFDVIARTASSVGDARFSLTLTERINTIRYDLGQ
ncbi:hypothetical protein [Phyllobacterium sp. YR531]|uniref:hypothetical protein n=1 Tax=Phyllobacterium sp. YR531 TaxID=1144343 RepID=UPI0002FCDB5B|nr:hypothetical protein [Phyllobacterium sp. YR531]